MKFGTRVLYEKVIKRASVSWKATQCHPYFTESSQWISTWNYHNTWRICVNWAQKIFT